MRHCGYCGKENDDAAGSCAGCGTSLLEPCDVVCGSRAIPWGAVFAWTAVSIGLFGIGRVVYWTLPFFWIHHDIGNGGFVWFRGVCITAFYTFVFALPCAIVGIVKRRRVLGWLGVVFAIAPLPLAFIMSEVAMALNGFRMTA